MTLDPKSLRLFITVVEQGTIAAAAAREHIAPAALSRRLSELESTLGAPLLERSNKGIAPTMAGRELLSPARKVLSDIDDLRKRLCDFAEGRRGHVRIHANISSITQFLPEDLARFLAASPDISVDLQESVSSEVVQAVMEKRADIGVITVETRPEGGRLLPYRTDRLVVIVPNEHPLTARQSIRFNQTLAYDYVGLHSGSQLNSLLDWAAREQQMPWRLRFKVRSYDALCRMVECGLGIGVLPEGVARRYVAAFPVTILQLEEAWADRELAIFVRELEELAPAARMLVAMLSATAAC